MTLEIDSKAKRKKSMNQEKRTALEFGGKTVPGSGALWGAKGDVKTDRFLIENKYTDTGVYVLSLKTWDKITQEALKAGLKIPLMQIDIGEANLKPLQFIVISSHDFSALGGKNFWIPSSLRVIMSKQYSINYRSIIHEVRNNEHFCSILQFKKYRNEDLLLVELSDFKHFLTDFVDT